MANTFKRYDTTATVSGVTAYTVPTNATSVVIGFTCANSDIVQRDISVDISGTKLVENVPVPAGATLSVLDGKIVATDGDVFTISSDADSAIDAMISVLEIT